MRQLDLEKTVHFEGKSRSGTSPQKIVRIDKGLPARKGEPRVPRQSIGRGLSNRSRNLLHEVW